MKNRPRLWVVAALCLNITALSVGQLPSQAAPTDAHRIVPGKSIGKLHLTHRGSAELKQLGKPDVFDAGMSQTRQVWISKGTPRQTLFVHTASNSVIDAKPASDVTIDTIRITSPDFHTQSGISTASTLAQIRSKYPHLKRESDQDPDQTVIYSDAHLGISFEFPKDVPDAHPLGITVFTPGGVTIVRQSNVENLIQSNSVK